jgi:hypothetical protein
MKMSRRQIEAWNRYLDLSAEIAKDEEKAYKSHWIHDHLDTPHVLISVVETKIARAVLAERRRIRDIALQWISELRGHDGTCSCTHNANILQDFINHEDFTEKSNEWTRGKAKKPRAHKNY